MLHTMGPDLQCSWFPELWIHSCCLEHDLGASDESFFNCLLNESFGKIGPLAWVFAVAVFLGMYLGRPVRFYFLNKRAEKETEEKDNG